MYSQKNEMKRQAVAYEQQVELLKQQLNQVNERERLRVEAIRARVGIEWSWESDVHCTEWTSNIIKDIPCY